ncbi:MAG: alpha-1,4-glucan--maltose-1-phosphate maltosyltransferase [Nitriliruptoraceae bacterium]|nr:alpha-1,4-glucan--maltose-1-phosphate maltosyltransferase [Nitriliruptoraceae bacterium]
MVTRARASIQRVRPTVLDGRYPARTIAGQPTRISADIVGDSHDLLAAVVRTRRQGTRAWTDTPMAEEGNDHWAAEVVLDPMGPHEFEVVAWIDHVATWCRDVAKKAAADTVEEVDLAVGAALLRARAVQASGPDAERLRRDAEVLTDRRQPIDGRVGTATADDLVVIAARHDPRDHATTSTRSRIQAERERAGFSTWYELFPRSASSEPDTHGTLRDVIDRLDQVASMGFDVLYLPPIHPIGVAHRKGRNNRVTAEPDDPGSPWAIGNADGGHLDIHPQLGTLEDLQALIAACASHGMELALDIAFQCSPDHPWVTEHPDWFKQRPDGSIQYAENPPKKYQDIYPIDFESDDADALWTALKGVFDHWIAQGVRIFRVDNPHTKSFAFWEWCLGELSREHPDCIFLAEAFTRPKVMYELAMRGFNHSYTYFTWRRHKWEIEAYYTELFQTEVADFFRPNSWPNTPDILTDQLQTGQRSMYVQRLVLAATLTANYGMYGPAFELMWSDARPGAEEYLDNEKYEIKRWDVDQPHSLREVIALINRIRHQHPALQQDRTLRFHHIDNDQLTVYSKRVGDDVLLMVVNLDAWQTQAGTTWLDLDELGVDPHEPFEVTDLFGGGTFTWQGAANYVELNPHVTPAHVFHVRTHRRTEADFDPHA